MGCTILTLEEVRNLKQEYKVQFFATLCEFIEDYKKFLDTRKSIIRGEEIIYLSGPVKNEAIRQFYNSLLQNTWIIEHSDWQIPRIKNLEESEAQRKLPDMAAAEHLQVLATLAYFLAVLNMYDYCKEEVVFKNTAFSLTVSSFEIIWRLGERKMISTLQVRELKGKSAEIKQTISQLEQNVLLNIHAKLHDEFTSEELKETEMVVEPTPILPMIVEYIKTAEELQIILNNFSAVPGVAMAVVENRHADYGCFLKLAMNTKDKEVLSIIAKKAPYLDSALVRNPNVSKNYLLKIARKTRNSDYLACIVANPKLSQDSTGSKNPERRSNKIATIYEAIIKNSNASKATLMNIAKDTKVKNAKDEANLAAIFDKDPSIRNIIIMRNSITGENLEAILQRVDQNKEKTIDTSTAKLTIK